MDRGSLSAGKKKFSPTRIRIAAAAMPQAGRKEGRKEGSRSFGLLLILSEVSFSGSDPAWVGVKFLSIGSYVSRKDKKIERVRKKDSKAC